MGKARPAGQTALCLCRPLSHSQTTGNAPLRHPQPQPSHPHGLLLPISFPPPAFPSPFTSPSPSTITRLCRQLPCPWGDVFLGIFCHHRHTQLFLCSSLSSITDNKSSLFHFCSQCQIFWLFSLQRVEVVAGGAVGWPAKLLPQQQ